MSSLSTYPGEGTYLIKLPEGVQLEERDGTVTGNPDPR